MRTSESEPSGSSGLQDTRLRRFEIRDCMVGSDQRLYEMCCSEGYCLVTLDLDFADITRFPPAKASGLVVIRGHRSLSFTFLEQLVRQFLQALSQMPIEGELWIVEPGRIRVHQSETNGH